MLHYHDQKRFGTCAAVAGNCPANLLITSLSAVSLEEKKKRNCAQMDFCARCLGSCLRAFPLVTSISLTEHLTGAACRHPSWAQFYLANGNLRKLTLVRWNHHRHGDLRTVQTSTFTIWTIERPLFETWWEDVTSVKSGTQTFVFDLEVRWTRVGQCLVLNPGNDGLGFQSRGERRLVVWAGFLWTLQLPAAVTHLWGELAVFLLQV